MGKMFREDNKRQPDIRTSIEKIMDDYEENFEVSKVCEYTIYLSILKRMESIVRETDSQRSYLISEFFPGVNIENVAGN